MKESALDLYRDLLGEIKSRVRLAQNRAALSASAEMILMYWDVGRMIQAKHSQEGWGAGVIPRLAAHFYWGFSWEANRTTSSGGRSTKQTA